MFVTIYASHPSRGKTQILAAFRASSGVTTTTVTSVDDAGQAAGIVDPLNRISAAATLPLSIYDRRGDRFDHYPEDHLAALTDVAQRPALLTGSHSLWYELAMFTLHQALADLERHLATVPQPVRQAVEAELAVEVRDLQAAMEDFSSGGEPEPPVQRQWDWRSPFIAYDSGMTELSEQTRERLDRLEADLKAEQVATVVEGLRLLCLAEATTANKEVHLDCAELSLMGNPDFARFYVSIEPPRPFKAGLTPWSVDVSQWVPDDPTLGPDDEDYGDSTGETIAFCRLRTAPRLEELVTLLDLSGKGGQAQLAEWARTPVGQALTGTQFVVTERPEAED